MTRSRKSPVLALLMIALGPGWAATEPPKLPVIEGRETIATVNGEPITLDDFGRQLAEFHGGGEPGPGASHRQDPAALLDRMITVRLILQEARNIGLGELPEVRRALEAQEREGLRDFLFQRRLGGVTEADPKEVERIYRNAVREYRLRSVLFEKEEDARAIGQQVNAGADFAALTREKVASGKAEGTNESTFTRRSALLPQIAAAVDTLKVGEVSTVIPVGKGFVLVQPLEIRYGDDEEARAQAQEEALALKRNTVIRQYVEELSVKYTKIDEALLDKLDFDAKTPGFKVFLEDTRPLATVQEEKPLLVKDLADALQKRFFHGLEGAAEKGKLNRRKRNVLDDLLNQRAVLHEARRLKLEEQPEFQRSTREHEEALLFGAFVQKVIDPEIRVEVEDLKKFQASHAAEYTTPEMMRLEALGFSSRKAAEAALSKLRSGASFGWLRENAEEQIDPKSRADFPVFGDGLLVVSELPRRVADALAGATSGDHRFVAEDERAYFVLHVRERVAPQPLPFEEIKKKLTERVVEEKREKGIEGWAAKLRQASEVKVFAEGEALTQILLGRSTR